MQFDVLLRVVRECFLLATRADAGLADESHGRGRRRFR